MFFQLVFAVPRQKVRSALGAKKKQKKEIARHRTFLSAEPTHIKGHDYVTHSDEWEDPDLGKTDLLKTSPGVGGALATKTERRRKKVRVRLRPDSAIHRQPLR